MHTLIISREWACAIMDKRNARILVLKAKRHDRKTDIDSNEQ